MVPPEIVGNMVVVLSILRVVMVIETLILILIPQVKSGVEAEEEIQELMELMPIAPVLILIIIHIAVIQQYQEIIGTILRVILQIQHMPEMVEDVEILEELPADADGEVQEVDQLDVFYLVGIGTLIRHKVELIQQPIVIQQCTVVTLPIVQLVQVEEQKEKVVLAKESYSPGQHQHPVPSFRHKQMEL